MAWISTERPKHPSSAFARRASILTDAIDTLLRCYTLSRERRNLSALNDRMLQDIGVTRADVEEECRKPFWNLR